MKFLTDFDGVLTNLGEETQRVREIFFSLIVKATDEVSARKLCLSSEEKMRQSPYLHGWRSADGRVTAFSNEDGFIFVNGLAASLDEDANSQDGLARITRWDLGRSGFNTFSEVAHAAYTQMTVETAAGKLSPMDPGAGAVLKTLIDKGHSIIVVSNSGTDRIRRILSESDVAKDLNDSSKIAIRGDARKFNLGASSENIQSVDYKIFVDRPNYRNILLEEKPDVVIGDVFSLDLSLPMFLVQQKKLAKAHLFLRRRDYTPAWSIDLMKNYIREANGGILERFNELLALA